VAYRGSRRDIADGALDALDAEKQLTAKLQVCLLMPPHNCCSDDLQLVSQTASLFFGLTRQRFCSVCLTKGISK
jgi:hypothetical protein